MIHKEIQSLSTKTGDLRKFGLLVGGVFLLIGSWCFWRNKSAWPWLVTPGAVLFLLGIALPVWLKHVYLAWMGMAFTLGLLVSTIILTVFFFAIVTPLGFLARLVGKDFLRLRFDPGAQTYWLPRDKSPQGRIAGYEQQF